MLKYLYESIFNRIANADPMIWGYVMLNDTNKANRK